MSFPLILDGVYVGAEDERRLSLQIRDIDSGRGLIHVHRGKGAKDRFLPLLDSTLQLLRAYW